MRFRRVPKSAFPSSSLADSRAPTCTQHAFPTSLDGLSPSPQRGAKEELQQGECEAEGPGKRVEVDIEREEDDVVG